MCLAKKRYSLLSRTVLKCNQEIFALPGDEAEQLPDDHLRITAERDDGVGDELQCRQEQLMMPFRRRRDEAVEFCRDASTLTIGYMIM